MKQNKKQAFTLIELLVVVLIIGILAAVALPQYTVAVDKARVTTSFPIARALKDAQARYYMANNTYSDPVENLDIDLPCEIQPSDPSLLSCPTGTIDNLVGNLPALDACRIGVYYKGIIRVDFYLEHSSRPNEIICVPKTDAGTRLCKALGFPME